MTSVKAALLSGLLLSLAPASSSDSRSKERGPRPMSRTSFSGHLMNIDIAGLGTATSLEAVSTTTNMKGEKMFDKMSAQCTALSVASGDKKYIDGACVLADSDGDKIFSTFDTRDLDKSQPEMELWQPYHHRRHRQIQRESPGVSPSLA